MSQNRRFSQAVLFISPSEVEYMSPTTPYYEAGGGHAATVLLLAHYKAQISPDNTMEKVIDYPDLEEHTQVLVAKLKMERIESSNS